MLSCLFAIKHYTFENKHSCLHGRQQDNGLKHKVHWPRTCCWPYQTTVFATLELALPPGLAPGCGCLDGRENVGRCREGGITSTDKDLVWSNEWDGCYILFEVVECVVRLHKSVKCLQCGVVSCGQEAFCRHFKTLHSSGYYKMFKMENGF